MDYGRMIDLLVVNSDGTHSKVVLQGDVNGGMNVVLDLESHVHQGKLFSHSDVYSLAVGASRYHLLDNSSGGEIHLHARELGLSPAEAVNFTYAMFEACTVSSVGSPRALVNRNRKFPDTTGLKYYSDPVVTSEGNLLKRVIVSDAGAPDPELEWVFDTGAKILLKATNRGSANASYSLGVIVLEV